MSQPNQLAVPPEVLSAPEAYELVRVWSAEDHQYYVLDVARISEPWLWGLIALDMIKHVARAYEQLDGRPKDATYQQILMGFMAEMQNPTEPL